MKYNTVLFKDSVNQYYIGTTENSEITKINYLQVSNAVRIELKYMLADVKLNEFLIVQIDMTADDQDNLKITPITCCTLTTSDSEDEIVPNLCEMGHDKLLETFNSLIPKKLLQDTKDE